MKKLLSLFATIMALMAVACGGDDVDKPAPKPGPVEPSEPNAPFVVDITGTTRGSVTFNVTPQNPTIDYVSVVYEKEVVESYKKDEFFIKDIFTHLTEEASSKGKLLGEYLPEIMKCGDAEGIKYTGLSMATDYYVVVFGVNYTIDGYVASTELVKKAFTTKDVEMSDATFEVETRVVYNNVTFTVLPSDKEMLYYICTMPKAYYDTYVGEGEGKMSQGAFYKDYFQNEINNLLKGGYTAEQVVMALIHNGDLRIGAEGLIANTDYNYLIAGMIMDEEGIVIVTDIFEGSYTTGDPEPSGLYFDIQIYDVQQMHVSFTVDPSNDKDTYVCIVQPYDGVSTAEEVMTDMVEQWGPGFMGQMANTKGFVDFATKPKSLPKAGIKYCIIAFGYSGGITSEAYMETFTALPGGSIEDVEFSVSASNITPYGFNMTVTSSDPTIYYALGVCTKDVYNEELFIKAVNDEFDFYNTETLKFDPTTIVAEVLDQYYDNGTMVFTLSGLVPNTEYMAYVYALDIDTGHVVKRFTFDAVACTGTVGTIHPTIKLVGFYSGDDEAGTIFSAPDVTAGKAIAVLTYENYDGASSLHAITVKGDGNDFTDIDEFPDAVMWQLTANLEGWVNCDLDHPYTFCVVDWNKECFALAYALDADGMSGRIARMSLVPTAANKGDIEDLRKLYDSLPKQEETRSVVAPSLVVVE